MIKAHNLNSNNYPTFKAEAEVEAISRYDDYAKRFRRSLHQHSMKIQDIDEFSDDFQAFQSARFNPETELYELYRHMGEEEVKNIEANQAIIPRAVLKFGGGSHSEERTYSVLNHIARGAKGSSFFAKEKEEAKDYLRQIDNGNLKDMAVREAGNGARLLEAKLNNDDVALEGLIEANHNDCGFPEGDALRHLRVETSFTTNQNLRWGYSIYVMTVYLTSLAGIFQPDKDSFGEKEWRSAGNIPREQIASINVKLK